MQNQILQEPERSPLSVTSQREPGTLQELAVAQPLSARLLERSEMVALQKRLVSRDKTVSWLAERELALMDSEALTAFLAFERGNRKRKIKAAAITLVCMYGGMITVSILTRQGGLFGMVGAFTGIMAAAAAFSKAYKSGVIALTRLENSESIGELVSALEIQDKEVLRVVRPALIKMLPKMRASDAKLLNDSSMQTLRRLLKGKFSGKLSASDYEADAQLRIATLAALQQIGDKSFRDVVENIIKGDGPRIYVMAQEITNAARECLPYLEQRELNLVASNELVRASDANHVGGTDILVRPVVGTVEMHEGELLRAVEESQ